MPATAKKPLRGGWAATLKSAALRGLPISMADPRYQGREYYVAHLLRRMNFASHYHDAVSERARQVGF